MWFGSEIPVTLLGQIQGLKHVVKTNSTTHAKGIDLVSQGNQDNYNRHDQQFIACKYDGDQEYYNQRDQQFFAHKYDGGLERVTINLVPYIILEEE